MDKEQVKAWKAGLDAADAFTLDEKRRRTPAERFALLETMQRESAGIESLKSREDSVEFHLRWNELQERWLARKL